GALSLSSFVLCLLSITIPFILIQTDEIRRELIHEMESWKVESDSIYLTLGSLSSRVKRQYGQEAGLEISLREEPKGLNAAANRDRVEGRDGYSEGIENVHSPGIAPSACGCKERENKCPPGEKGAKGKVGAKGEDGVEGEPGSDGINTKDVTAQRQQYDQCFNCPMGPPGETGPPGALGLRGMRGRYSISYRFSFSLWSDNIRVRVSFFVSGARGQAAIPGRDGGPGFSGTLGIHGPPGPVGEKGAQGDPGVDVEHQVGLPGPKGPTGVPGEVGDDGDKGDEGPVGNGGIPGERGTAGEKGEDGAEGSEGHHGEEGEAGKDMDYCGCPESGVSVEENPSKEEKPITSNY
ncbi:hypothetical protein PENTCL1PPCAC_6519, partial [Pristionchus entomophagus]